MTGHVEPRGLSRKRKGSLGTTPIQQRQDLWNQSQRPNVLVSGENSQEVHE